MVNHIKELEISIHAPAKGATVLSHLLTQLLQDFNPRSREGSDPSPPSCTFLPSHFNPRSREGSDARQQQAITRAIISIHAPAKGATKKLRRREKAESDFNPRSREGSDLADFIPLDGASRFQSTLPRRERQNNFL